MKPDEKVLSGLEGVVESEGVVRFRITLEKTAESEVGVLTKVYALAMQKYQGYEKAAESAPEPNSCTDAAIVRNTEEVRHVEQRLDRSSEITRTQLHSSPLIRGLIRPGGNSLLGKEREW